MSRKRRTSILFEGINIALPVLERERARVCSFFFLPFLPLPLPFPLHPPSLLSSSSFLLFLTLEPRRKRRFRKQKRSHSRVLQREKIRDWDARETSEKERERDTKGGRVPVKEDSVSLFAGGLIRAQGHFYTEPSLVSSAWGLPPLDFFFHICYPVYFWPASPRISEDYVGTLILVSSSVMGDYSLLRILNSNFYPFELFHLLF